MLSLSLLAVSDVVPYDKWEHHTPMDTMKSKAEAYSKYMSEHLATGDE